MPAETPYHYLGVDEFGNEWTCRVMSEDELEGIIKRTHAHLTDDELENVKVIVGDIDD